jgi:proteasome lid subunit RPN8/RPN11
MIPIAEPILAAIREHAEKDFPKEACGVVIVRRGKQVYVPCANCAIDPGEHFLIAPAEYAAAEEAGEVIRVVHSHPNLSPQPSEADKVGCEASGVPWLIINWPTGRTVEFAPSGYEAPLVGRSFHHGILDCYSLVRDYYRREVGLEIPDMAREAHWWIKGQNLYADNFTAFGFVEIEPEQLCCHDALLMQVASPVINHAAIYVGDNMIIQHCAGRLSSRDVYGGGWQRATRKVLRHKSLCQTG